jgi:hypothetical protein
MGEAMSIREASCSCGQLRISCHGEPVRISICHCLACQRRTGSVFGTQARFPREQIKGIQGRFSEYVRVADSGNSVRFRFCPDCGSTLFWELDGFPDVIAIAVGGFTDPDFPAPRHSVYESHRHPWAVRQAELDMEHLP